MRMHACAGDAAESRFYFSFHCAMRRGEAAENVNGRDERLYAAGDGDSEGTGATAAAAANECGVCGKAFASLLKLQRHLRVHTGERPFKCGKCGRRFKRNGDLTAHKRTHTGERPYQCATCSKRFTQSSHLKRHEVTHLGLKPHACTHPGCSY